MKRLMYTKELRVWEFTNPFGVPYIGFEFQVDKMSSPAYRGYPNIVANRKKLAAMFALLAKKLRKP